MNFSYFYTIFFKLKKDKFSDYCRSRSVDGGNTSVIFDSDIAIISHEGVVNEMETYCKRWSSGNIERVNCLGFLRLNSKLFEDLSPPFMTLNSSSEYFFWIKYGRGN